MFIMDKTKLWSAQCFGTNAFSIQELFPKLSNALRTLLPIIFILLPLKVILSML